MMAAYVAMVSEVFVDQLMDVTLSSIWLAFLMINTRLLLISPLLIIVIYGFIAGFTLYRFGVFVPVVERARALRASRLMAAKDFHRSPSLEGKSAQWGVTAIKRIGYKSMDYLGNWMDMFSESAVISRKARAFSDNEAWGSMNRTPLLVGAVSPSTSQSSRLNAVIFEPKESQYSIETRDLAPGKTFPRTVSYRAHRLRSPSSLQLKTLSIPPSIMALRSSHNFSANAKKDNEALPSDQHAVIHTFDIDDLQAPCVSSQTPVISGMVPALIGDNAKSFRANKEITSDPHVALRQMLTIHVLGAEAHRRGETLSAFEIPEAVKSVFFLSELELLLSSIFDTFYPNNVVLTDMERIEAVELLRSWHKSLQAPSTIESASEKETESRSVDDAEEGEGAEQGVSAVVPPSSQSPSLSNSDRISFPAFAEWFLHLAQLIHTMHTVAGAGCDAPLHDLADDADLDDTIPKPAVDVPLASHSNSFFEVKSWW